MRRLLFSFPFSNRVMPTLLVSFFLLPAAYVQAAITSDIANTKHNFSATVIPPASTDRTASATSESQICAFCHTPHGATDEPKAPLWNRQLNNAGGYTVYDSTSLEDPIPQPGGKSKLCLSCHDGTIALGQVNVLNRVENPSITMSGTNPDGTITDGPHGADTGFTRRIGVDLSNDHPISMTFDSSRASSDGELYDPAVEPHLNERVAGSPPALPQGSFLPLETDKVECISCHDPHVQSDVAGENNKFLRVNRFQQQPPVDDHTFDEQNDIICLGCHDKAGWVGSAHALPAVANERYDTAAAELREFPANMQVWQAACLNCHDPHTVQGSRRILREGTDGPVAISTDPDSAGARYKQGGNPAVEEVCWACHSADGQVLQGQVNPSINTAFEVPDIKTDFTTMARHMPIQSVDQMAGSETHSIGTTDGLQGTQVGQDFIEDPANLGPGSRHAECTDCHNPHRVMKNRLFNANNSIPDAAGTHEHEDGVPHTNLASGVLRGIWGVEPVYSSTEFGPVVGDPVSFEVKRGDPGRDGAGTTAVSEPYLTREYQLCFKCHSNYTYGATPPMLGSSGGGTPPGTNSMTQYTNQAMEYQSPDDHMREGTSGTPTGAYSGLDGGGNTVDYENNNHRSWHPVMKPTGRDPLERGANADDWRPPFNAAVGTQTMYCTDCHGSSTFVTDGAVPKNGENGYPWGPHGSDDDFLLKGPWNNLSGRDQPNALCFRCHEYDQYGRAVPVANWPPGPAPTPAVQQSGFKANVTSPVIPFWGENLHVGHSSLLDQNFGRPFLCSFCHVAVPHGWKNKVFLANLNDVGLEAGLTPGTQVRYTGFSPSGTGRYYQGPYYNGAALKVKNFARSGEWAPTDCGSAGAPGSGVTGQAWMAAGSEACLLLP